MPNRTNDFQVRIEPWADADLDLLYRLNAPEMLEHLGGPETEEQILARHKRYVEIGGKGTGRMFSIILLPDFEKVDNIGYWERVWQEETVYEMGWGVLPPFQGRGKRQRLLRLPSQAPVQSRRSGTFTRSRPLTTPRQTRFAGSSASCLSPNANSNIRRGA